MESQELNKLMMAIVLKKDSNNNLIWNYWTHGSLIENLVDSKIVNDNSSIRIKKRT